MTTSQHRHELQKNDLEQFSEHALKYLDRYGFQMLLGVGAVVVIGIVGSIIVGQIASSNASSWSTALNAVFSNSAEEYAQLAESQQNRPVGDWALLRESELRLEEGLKQIYTDRESALSTIKRVRDNLQKLVQSSNVELRERALFGLAQALECSSDDNTDAAAEAYERFAREFPESFLVPVAQKRAKDLKTGSAKAFYKWLADTNPRPTAPSGPKDGPKNPHNEFFPEGEPDLIPGTKKPDATKDTQPASEPSSEKKPEAKPETKPEEPASGDKKPEPKADEKKPDSPDASTKPEAKP